MNRFHVHVAVQDLDASVTFYTQLFGQAPSKTRGDYAKWMLEDPRLNFAISARGHAPGLNHFGMQVETPEDLARLKALADAVSGGTTLDERQASCCYAKSDKHWTLDPQGLAWEHFLTLEEAETYGAEAAAAVESAAESAACCIPLHAGAADAAVGLVDGPTNHATNAPAGDGAPSGVTAAAPSCCVPRADKPSNARCC